MSRALDLQFLVFLKANWEVLHNKTPTRSQMFNSDGMKLHLITIYDNYTSQLLLLLQVLFGLISQILQYVIYKDEHYH